MAGERVTLEVTARDADQVGSRRVRRLRKEGFVPGVLYGKGHTRAILIKERALRTALTGKSGLHAIVDVVIEGQKTPHHAVLKQYQQHPIRGTLTHVDFHEVRLDQPIQSVVAVHLIGESPGANEGGVVQQVSRELNVESLPTDIPEHIDADISSLELNGTLRLEELPAIEGVTYLDDPETVLATCVIPRAAIELEEADAEAAAEAEAEASEGEDGEVAEGEAAAESSDGDAEPDSE